MFWNPTLSVGAVKESQKNAGKEKKKRKGKNKPMRHHGKTEGNEDKQSKSLNSTFYSTALP